MKKPKIVLTLLISLLLCGCTVDYQIVIDKDLAVSENILATFPNSFYYGKMYSSIDYTLNSLYDAYEYDIRSGGYHHNKYNDGNNAGYRLNKTYDTLEDFITVSTGYLEYFDKLNYNVDDDIVTINTVGNLKMFYEENTETYGVTDANISVKIPFKLIDSDADECIKNSRYNICTWKINTQTTSKSIMLKFDKGEFIGYSDDIIMVIYVIMGVGLLVFAFYVANKMIKRNRL